MSCADQTARRIGTVHHWPGDSIKHLPRTHAQHLASVASYRAYHKSIGYCDLAYNDVVCPCGVIIPGRGLSKRSGANGNLELNNQYASLLWLLGVGEAGTPKQIAAAEAWCRKTGGVRKAHGEVRPGGTACPGPWVTSWVHGTVVKPPPIPQPEDEDMPTIIRRESNGALAVYNGVYKWRIGSNSPTYVARAFPGIATVNEPDWFWDAIPDAGNVDYRITRYLDAKNSETLGLVREILSLITDFPRKVWGYKNPVLDDRDTYQILRDIDAKEPGSADPAHTHSTPAGETGPVSNG